MMGNFLSLLLGCVSLVLYYKISLLFLCLLVPFLIPSESQVVKSRRRNSLAALTISFFFCVFNIFFYDTFFRASSAHRLLVDNDTTRPRTRDEER